MNVGAQAESHESVKSLDCNAEHLDQNTLNEHRRTVCSRKYAWQNVVSKLILMRILLIYIATGAQ